MVPLHLIVPFLNSVEGGFRLQSYDDKTGKDLNEGDTAIGTVTISKGLTEWEDGTPIAPGSTITLQRAFDLFYLYIKNTLNPSIKRLLRPDVYAAMTDNQKAAYGSFVFNFGETKARGYTLTRLINEGAPDEEIARWWVKYNRHKDEPTLGLYRRRIGEVLLWHGLDWRIWPNLAWSSDVIDVMKQMGWQGKEQEPETYLGYYDPTPETEWTTQDLNTAQLWKMQGKPGNAPISPNTRKPEEVPYGIDPQAGLKPMEDSGRFKEAARAKSARDDQDVGRAATATAAGLGVANTIVSETTTLLDSVTGYVIVLLVVLFIFGAVWWGVGKWREYDAEKKRLQAEIDARQGLY